MDSQRLADRRLEQKWTARFEFRIDQLRQTGALVQFLSLEPLLGPMEKLNLDGIAWVIVGGESGPQARPMERAWGGEIRDRCALAGVPFFFKQWGRRNKRRNGWLLDGQTWDQMPMSIHALAGQCRE